MREMTVTFTLPDLDGLLGEQGSLWGDVADLPMSPSEVLLEAIQMRIRQVLVESGCTIQDMHVRQSASVETWDR
jgi:hypothetical protein